MSISEIVELHGKFSACCLQIDAKFRSRFLISMTAPTASANDCGLLFATTPTGCIASRSRYSPTALEFDATTGVPEARDSRAARQNVSIGPGANETSADARISETRSRSAIYPRKDTGKSLNLFYL